MFAEFKQIHPKGILNKMYRCIGHIIHIFYLMQCNGGIPDKFRDQCPP